MFQSQGHGPTQLLSLSSNTTAYMLILISGSCSVLCPEAASNCAHREAVARGTAST